MPFYPSNQKQKHDSRSWWFRSNIVHDPVDSFDLEEVSAIMTLPRADVRSSRVTGSVIGHGHGDWRLGVETYLVCYSRRDLLENGRWEDEPIGSHEVIGRYRPQGDDLIVCPSVSGHTDSFDR